MEREVADPINLGVRGAVRCRQIRTEPEYDFQQFIEAGATRKINATPGSRGAGDHALTAMPATPAALPDGADDVMYYNSWSQGSQWPCCTSKRTRWRHTWSRGAGELAVTARPAALQMKMMTSWITITGVEGASELAAAVGHATSRQWICDILVRIRIRGAMLLTNGSGSCYFCHWPLRGQQKSIFFCSLLVEGTFTSFFKDKKS